MQAVLTCTRSVGYLPVKDDSPGNAWDEQWSEYKALDGQEAHHNQLKDVHPRHDLRKQKMGPWYLFCAALGRN